MTARDARSDGPMERDLNAPDSLLDTRNLLLYMFVTHDGVARVGGTTKDWEWVAQSFRLMADQADEKRAASKDAS